MTSIPPPPPPRPPGPSAPPPGPAPSPGPAPTPPTAGRKLPVGTLLVAVAVAVAAVGGVLVGMRLTSDSDGGEVVALPERTTTTEERETTTTVTAAPTYTAEEIAELFGPAVWRVETFGCGEMWTGTAFAVDPHHLVTNHHVVSNDTRPDLISRAGERIGGTVIGWAIRPDVALIRVEEPLEAWLEWAPTSELREGQSLAVLGYPVPATDFTTTPGTVLSFQMRGDRREAIRSDAALDRGNSGGPALDSRGRVVGVVTEMAPNLSGFQLIPLIFTHDALRMSIEMFFAAPYEPLVDCGWDHMMPEPGTAEEPETWTSGAFDYGDHPLLDELWDACVEGDFDACDELWWMAPVDSVYEWFGDTCGGRNEPAGWCVDIYWGGTGNR